MNQDPLLVVALFAAIVGARGFYDTAGSNALRWPAGVVVLICAASAALHAVVAVLYYHWLTPIGLENIAPAIALCSGGGTLVPRTSEVSVRVVATIIFYFVSRLPRTFGTGTLADDVTQASTGSAQLVNFLCRLGLGAFRVYWVDKLTRRLEGEQRAARADHNILEDAITRLISSPMLGAQERQEVEAQFYAALYRFQNSSSGLPRPTIFLDTGLGKDFPDVEGGVLWGSGSGARGSAARAAFL